MDFSEFSSVFFSPSGPESEQEATPGESFSPPQPISKQAQLWRDIQAYMKQERPYLDPLFMQRDLADHFNISTRTLCRLVGQFDRNNFNGFVNRYRVDEVTQMMRDRQYAPLNVEALAQQAGFNSRGSFYRAFKLVKGESPAQYRQRIS